jgi:hypothetical protein
MILLFQKEAPAIKSNNLVWSWRNALFTAGIAAIPVLIIATGHVEAGLSLLLGALPASIMGLPSTCKQHRKMIVIGILGIFLIWVHLWHMGPSCNSRYVLASIWYNTTSI